jgi:hypothetical protein
MQSRVEDGKVVIEHDGKSIALDIWVAHQAAMQMLVAINEANHAPIKSEETE